MIRGPSSPSLGGVLVGVLGGEDVGGAGGGVLPPEDLGGSGADVPPKLGPNDCVLELSDCGAGSVLGSDAGVDATAAS